MMPQRRLSKPWFAVLSVGLALPAVGRAANVDLSYDLIQIAMDAAFTTGVHTVSLGGANTIDVPLGAYFRFSLQSAVTGNSNSAAAIANTNFGPQPSSLGLAGFNGSITNSAPAVVAPRISSGSLSTATVNPLFSSLSSQGKVDAPTGNVGTGGVASEIFGGVNAAAIDTTTASGRAKLTIGTTGNGATYIFGTLYAGDDLFTGLAYSTPGVGKATLTPSLPTNGLALIAPNSPGNASTPPIYSNRNFRTDDTLAPARAR